MTRAFCLAAALLFAAIATPSAHAQWGGSGWGWGGFGTNYYGYGLPAGWYTGVQGRMPPYFALHPPVYYSGQINRIPYGASPFAYPWGTPWAAPAVAPVAMSSSAVAEVAAAEPVLIENEYYQAGAKGKKKPAANDAAAATGQMIVNPFYEPAPRFKLPGRQAEGGVALRD
jgi:hypothetical protein